MSKANMFSNLHFNSIYQIVFSTFFVLSFLLEFNPCFASTQFENDDGLQFLRENGASLVSPTGEMDSKKDDFKAIMVLKYAKLSGLKKDILLVNITPSHPKVLGNLGFCAHLFQHFPTFIIWGQGDLEGFLYQKFGQHALYKDLTGLHISSNTPKKGLLQTLDKILKFAPHKISLRFLSIALALEDSDFNTIGGAIKGLEHLSVVDLSGQINLGGDGLKMLGEIMAESPHLKALILQNVDLREQKTFPTVWPKHLTHIDLRESKIPPVALKPLLESTKAIRFSHEWVEGDFDRSFALGLLNKSLKHSGKGLPKVLLARPHFKKLLNTFAKIPMLAGLMTLIGKDLSLEDIKSIQGFLAQGSNMNLQSNILMGEVSSGAKATWTDFHSMANNNKYKQTSGKFEIKNTGDRSGVRHWEAYRLIQYFHDTGATVSLKILWPLRVSKTPGFGADPLVPWSDSVTRLFRH